MISTFIKWLVIYLTVCGLVLHAALFWFIAYQPLYFDRLLIVDDKPIESPYIVCVAGGLSGNNLPTAEGMQRIYTAVQLYFDGFAPKIIFTGGGTERVSEAEVYSEVAAWFGAPKNDMILDPYPSGTAEHPYNVLSLQTIDIDKTTALNIVTSRLHSKRVALCFRKAGFENFRMVTRHISRLEDPELVRSLKRSGFEDFTPSGKSYGDPLNRLRWRLDYFFTALREVAALVWYWWRGYI